MNLIKILNKNKKLNEKVIEEVISNLENIPIFNIIEFIEYKLNIKRRIVEYDLIIREDDWKDNIIMTFSKLRDCNSEKAFNIKLFEQNTVLYINKSCGYTIKDLEEIKNRYCKLDSKVFDDPRFLIIHKSLRFILKTAMEILTNINNSCIKTRV